MPMHDWTRVSAGTYHNFQFAWANALMNRLNAGLLPQGYFAMAEQTVEPTAVGCPLPTVPLFLSDDIYVRVPLEETYQATWAVMPAEIRELFDPRTP